MLSVRRVLDRPQVLSTNRHVMQGYVDLKNVMWKAGKSQLVGRASVVQGETYKIIVALNGREAAAAGSSEPGVTVAIRLAGEGLAAIAIDSDAGGWTDWWASFAPHRIDKPTNVKYSGRRSARGEIASGVADARRTPPRGSSP